MNLPTIFTDRKARDAFKDKFELVMAVVVIGSFVHKKFKGQGSSSPIPYGNESVAGVENILNQYGDSAIYNIIVKEK